MNYPNPCDTCEKKHCHYMDCGKYKMRYIYRQKQINSFARKLMRPRGPRIREAFLYDHPDIIRRYLEHGPCKGCKAEEVCDTPCPAYLGWWDARMERLKGVWGL